MNITQSKSHGSHPRWISTQALNHLKKGPLKGQLGQGG